MVSLNDNISSVSDIDVEANGILIIKTGKTLTVGSHASPKDINLLTNGNIVIEQGGKLNIYGQLITNNSSNITNNGEINLIK